MAKFFSRRQRRVLLDIDTQVDLVQVYNGMEVSQFLRHLRRLIAWARRNRIPVISTQLCLRVDNTLGHEGKGSLCVEGTPGQRKISYTCLPHSVVFNTANSTDLPSNLLGNYQQIIFEKRTSDTFAQPRADRLLSESSIEEFIVFGTGTELAIHQTVLGLLSRQKSVTVVTDAITGQSKDTSALSLRKMSAKGAKLVTTESLAGKSRLVDLSRVGTTVPLSQSAQ